jgi:hypothetical protein
MESELGDWGILNGQVMSDGRKLGRLKSTDTAECASDENRIIWMRQCHHKGKRNPWHSACKQSRVYASNVFQFRSNRWPRGDFLP